MKPRPLLSMIKIWVWFWFQSISQFIPLKQLFLNRSQVICGRVCGHMTPLSSWTAESLLCLRASCRGELPHLVDRQNYIRLCASTGGKRPKVYRQTPQEIGPKMCMRHRWEKRRMVTPVHEGLKQTRHWCQFTLSKTSCTGRASVAWTHQVRICGPDGFGFKCIWS